MQRFGRLRGWIASGLATATLVGCGGTGLPTNPIEASDVTSLNEVGEAYRIYSITKKHPPRKIAELATVEAAGGNGVASVKAGTILVEWGATLPSTGEEVGNGSSAEVLAYGKAVPEQGGHVLMLDRSVKKMTAEEFKAAPRPAGATSAPPKK